MTKKGQSQNYQFFLKLDTSRYKGKWIALTKNKVAAVAEDAGIAYKKAQKKFPKAQISLAKVPREATLVLIL